MSVVSELKRRKVFQVAAIPEFVAVHNRIGFQEQEEESCDTQPL